MNYTTTTISICRYLSNAFLMSNNLLRLHNFRQQITWYICYQQTFIRQLSSTMTESEQCFKGQLNHYNAVIVNSTEEPCETLKFAKRLKASLEEWTQMKRKSVWFEVSTKEAEWIPILIKENFKFHHAKEDKLTLYKWLSKDAICNIPHYAHTNIGVGAFVYDKNTQEILVIKEKNASLNMWKLPGGYMEPNENIGDAIEREVLEETGIRANFKYMLGFRHTHHHTFECSDIYILTHLTPLSREIKMCSLEISECLWMKLSEFEKHPQVHENNKFAARKMNEHLTTGIGIEAMHAIHPISKKPIFIYTINNNITI